MALMQEHPFAKSRSVPLFGSVPTWKVGSSRRKGPVPFNHTTIDRQFCRIVQTDGSVELDRPNLSENREETIARINYTHDDGCRRRGSWHLPSPASSSQKTSKGRTGRFRVIAAPP